MLRGRLCSGTGTLAEKSATPAAPQGGALARTLNQLFGRRFPRLAAINWVKAAARRLPSKSIQNCPPSNLACYFDEQQTLRGTTCQAFDPDCGSLGKKCCPST